MPIDPPPLTKDDPAERSLVGDVRQLVEDGRTLLEAELAYQKSRAVVAGQAVKDVVGWGALALVLVFFALMVLVLGLVLALTPLIGALGATAIVVLGVLAAAALCGWVAVKRWKRASAQLGDTEPKS